VNPVDLAIELVIWNLRSAGRRVITAAVLMGAVVVMTVALFVPLVLAALLIGVFDLTVEPNKWLGSVLIVGAFALGIILAAAMTRRTVRRGMKIIALAESRVLGDHGADTDGPSAGGAQPSDRDAWVASIRALDQRHAPKPGAAAVGADGIGPPPAG
jgi:hypothetical protein